MTHIYKPVSNLYRKILIFTNNPSNKQNNDFDDLLKPVIANVKKLKKQEDDERLQVKSSIKLYRVAYELLNTEYGIRIS